MAETNGLSDRCNKMDVIDALLMECFHRPDSVCVGRDGSGVRIWSITIFQSHALIKTDMTICGITDAQHVKGDLHALSEILKG